jgi:hypothetical protein
MPAAVERTYARRLGLPRPAAVDADAAGTPTSVAGRPVAVLRDEWRVEEGWWTRKPVRRVYYDLVLADGRNTVVFCDRRRDRWFEQRA